MRKFITSAAEYALLFRTWKSRAALPGLDAANFRPPPAAVLPAAALLFFQAAAAPSLAHDLEDLSDADRAILRQEFRGYLLANPEVLLEAYDLLEQRQAQAENRQREIAIKANADELFNDPNSWQGGNPDGDVAVVEFVDYRCGFCRKAHPDIQELLATDPGIKMIVKEFPILSQESYDSAKLALSALRMGGSGAYRSTHDFLINYNGPIDSDAVEQVSQLTGIGKDALETEARSAEIEDIIRANYRLADALAISGTPAFVIGTALYPGYAPLDELRKLIESERNKKE